MYRHIVSKLAGYCRNETSSPRPRKLQLSALIVLAAGLGAGGCMFIADRMAPSRIEREIKILDGDAALFRQCLETRGGTCQGNASTALPQTGPMAGTVAPLRAGLSAPVATAVAALGPNHPARAANSVLSHPFLQKIAAVHNHLRGLPSPHPVSGVEVTSADSATAPETTLALSTSPEELSDFVDQVNQATASGAWRALSDEAGKQAAALDPNTGTSFIQARQDARTAAFIRRYTDAYFDSGKLVQIELNTQNLESKVENYLAHNASLFCGDPSQSAPSCGTLASSFQNEILRGVAKDSANQDFLLLKLGTQGYVSRTGQSFHFPGINVTLDPAGGRLISMAKINLTQVGTDLVWVFFQALFDAQEGLPAVSNATGVDLGTAGRAFDLPVFNPSLGSVNEQDFQDITAFSNRVGGVAGTAFDKAIRGLGPFSLNNEALEELLTATVTVTVDNAAQKGAWCWYSCNLDQQIATATADEKARIRSDFDRKARRIKLRLRL